MKVLATQDPAQLEPVIAAWDKLSATESHFVPGSADLRRNLREARRFSVLTAAEDGQIKAVACFIYHDGFHRFEIANRKLFDLPVREVTLYGACIPGHPDEATIRRLFNVFTSDGGFDVINIGEIIVDSPLYRAITTLGRGCVAWSIRRKIQPRWMIQMPRSFDDYLASMRPTARARIMRDHRRFERASPRFKVTLRPEEIEDFAHDAEAVSRLTYQWRIGWGFSSGQIARLKQIAGDGTFRGYLAYLDGKPCAFGWGELCNGMFSFRFTGYDPAHRYLSPGTSIILYIVRDLIENTNCRLFDFWSGSETGYKSRFANTSSRCARMQVAQIYRPYSFFIIVLDKSLNLLKNTVMDLIGVVLGNGPLRRRLNSFLRPFGVGSY
jgi:Acetyltransferase (GNAT) domain